ncbi:uncharacterized protein METZ01_LOCUS133916, partial [marine metagenome]
VAKKEETSLQLIKPSAIMKLSVVLVL